MVNEKVPNEWDEEKGQVATWREYDPEIDGDPAEESPQRPAEQGGE